MALNNTPEVKGGFFTGATDVITELIKTGKSVQAAENESARQIVEIGGGKYYWDAYNRQYRRFKEPIPDDEMFPSPLEFFTLDGLISYIVTNVEGLIPDTPDKKLILQVVDHRKVVLLSHPSEHKKERHVIASCMAHVPDLTFGSYLDTERFNTMLLSKFVETDSRDTLFKVVKSMTKEQSCTTTDDGVSQAITVKQGIASASNVVFQNPVPLKPMRTFTEIDQPESNFTLRVNEDAQCALFEADGGAWKNQAVRQIANYLIGELIGQNVIVIA